MTKPEADVSQGVDRGVKFIVGGLSAAFAVMVLGVGAVDVLTTGLGTGSASRSLSIASMEVEHRVLADEWNDRISNDNFWRANRGSGNNAWSNTNSKQRAKPSLLQGPPQQPAWFVQPPSNFWPSEETRGQPSKSPRAVSGFRTVCVRLCDGFFFPISFGASEGSLSRDQATCSNSCAGARLYHYKSAGEDPDDMVDSNGQPYSRMKNANLFRTQYVENCKCKPHPWEKEATDKHRIFALEDQRRKGNRAVVAELDELKSKNLESRYNRRRPTDRRRNQNDAAAAVAPVEASVVAQSTAPRSDASRGQSADRVAFHQVSQPAQGVVTGSIAAEASAATVRSFTDRQARSAAPVTASAPVVVVPVARNGDEPGNQVDFTVGRDGAVSDASPDVLGPQAVEPNVRPAGTKSRQGRNASRRDRSGANSRLSGMLRLGVARQPDTRRIDFAAQRRPSEWSRGVYNP